MNAYSRPLSRIVVVLSMLVATGSTRAQTPTVENTIRLRIEQVRELPAATVRGSRLLRPDAVARFFEARTFTPAWRLPAAAQQVLGAIRNIEQDGLTPADYHLSAITAALDAYTKAPSTEVMADLHVLIADAAVALIDDVRYGRVRPSSLDRRWNVDPRNGAPALDLALAEVARAASIDAGIEAQIPTHFIYTGLKQALARMRSAVKAGGWPIVTSGAAIKPGATNPRVAMVRNRLLVTGELGNATSTADAVYGDDLLGAVKTFQAHHRLTEDGVIGKATIDAMNISAEARAQQLRVNLERARWVVGGLSDTFVLVNLPAFKVYLIRDKRMSGKGARRSGAKRGKRRRSAPT